MQRLRNALNGWSLAGLLSLAVTLMAFAVAAAHQFDVEGVRAVIRATARTSLLLFGLAFSAAALQAFWPNAWTGWQRRNRRYLGVAFAASHLVHAVAILSLSLVSPPLFRAAVTPPMLIFGGIGYAFIALMVATSFDRTARLIGPRAWRVLHWTGANYLWLAFLNGFLSRAGAEPLYWLPVALLVAIMSLRIARWYVARRVRARVA
jgi:DMSO/TMAO reductase YedYZ heme-binding membrane subunit